MNTVNGWATIAKLMLMFAVAVSTAGTRSAAAPTAGYFDPSFGSGGVVQIDYANADDSGTSLAAGRGGEILVGGLTNISIVLSGVATLRSNGTLETAFGHVAYPGRAPVLTAQSANGTGERSGAVGRQSTGMPIYTASYLRAGQYRAMVGRCSDLQCAQSPYSFHAGVGIELTFPAAIVNAYALALHVDASDNIVVAGRADYSEAGLCTGWVARLNPDLSLNSVFGLPIHHVRLVGLPEQCSDFRAVTVQPNGNVVAVGRSVRYNTPADGGQFFVARLGGNGDNALDFNGGNPLLFGFRASPNEDVANAVALDRLGRIVIAGYAQFNNSADYDYAIARLTYAGQLDTSFGSGGKVYVTWDAGGDNQDLASGVAIDYADKIIVTGRYRSADFTAASAVGTARLNVNGSLDASFGVGGKSYARVAAGSDDLAAALVRDSSGRIVIAGTTNANAATQGQNAFVMRLYGEGIFADGLE